MQSRFTLEEIQRVSLPRRRRGSYHSGAGLGRLHRFSQPRRQRARQSTPVQAEVRSVETKTRSLSESSHSKEEQPELVDGVEDWEKPYDFSKTGKIHQKQVSSGVVFRDTMAENHHSAALRGTNPEERLYAPWIYATDIPPGGKSDVMRGEAVTLPNYSRWLGLRSDPDLTLAVWRGGKARPP
ncbi:hypothetical protein HID58_038259 [Brassica napus]|uniref:Uncharacterized protein n=1 Tax=Brassica napus TaxID=3708 RepID=A0ABQ8BNQ4_BRANA|nr:hypothetical protein HID58_038259 [Brassica napus]